jgi:hypothetical protein
MGAKWIFPKFQLTILLNDLPLLIQLDHFLMKTRQIHPVELNQE